MLAHPTPDVLANLGIHIGLQAIYLSAAAFLLLKVRPTTVVPYILANSMAVAYWIKQWFNREYDPHNALDALDALLLSCTIAFGVLLTCSMTEAYAIFAYRVLHPRWSVIWRTR